MNFIAYSDESYITAHRYRSISTMSFAESASSSVHATLEQVYRSSDVREFKWKKLESAKYRHCALKMIDALMRNLATWNVRIDTIIWDTHDSRHSVKNRDDSSNFERMFFHLHHAALRRRPKGAKWRLYPDERMGVDWANIRECLTAVGRRQELIRSPLFGDFFADKHYHISAFDEVESKDSPCSQMADLFAGIAVFSRTHHNEFWSWHSKKTPSLGLLELENIRESNSTTERFDVLAHLNHACKTRSLGVSLKREGGLHTYDPRNPINFWLYKPQHLKDVAPRKGCVAN
jgi:hypothetical protein